MAQTLNYLNDFWKTDIIIKIPAHISVSYRNLTDNERQTIKNVPLHPIIPSAYCGCNAWPVQLSVQYSIIHMVPDC